MSKTINDVIEEYCKKKLPPSEIFRLMKEVVSRRGVYKAVKRFKDTRTCAPRIRSDPERTVRTKCDLQSYPYKFTKRHLLSEATKKKRLDRAKVLVKKCKINMCLHVENCCRKNRQNFSIDLIHINIIFNFQWLMVNNLR